jgi:hypothetical protein
MDRLCVSGVSDRLRARASANQNRLRRIPGRPGGGASGPARNLSCTVRDFVPGCCKDNSQPTASRGRGVERLREAQRNTVTQGARHAHRPGMRAAGASTPGAKSLELNRAPGRSHVTARAVEATAEAVPLAAAVEAGAAAAAVVVEAVVVRSYRCTKRGRTA